MFEIRQTAVFASWLTGLRDHQRDIRRAKARIAERLHRFGAGNPGDIKSVGDGVTEMRIDYGPGYRVYYTRRGSVVVILLCGGDKRGQQRDIRRAKTLAAEIEE